MKANPFAQFLAPLFALCLLASAALAAPPVANDISPRGLQIGATTKVVVRGQALESPTGLLIPGLAFQAAPMESATGKQVEFEITVAPDAAPGIYPCWFTGVNGVSNVVPLTVHHFPQQTFEPTIASRPVALQGNIQGGQILTSTFAGKKGERIVLEIDSRRLGFNLRPVIRLLNPKGTQVAWSQGEDRLDGDGRCEAVLSEDGDYTIQVHDLLYKGQGPGLFVLKVGDLPTADLAFPIGVQRGTNRDVRFLLGSLAGQSTQVQVAADDLRSMVPVVPSGPVTGSLPRIQLSDLPELTEEEAVASLPTAPLGISGILAKPAQRDQFLIAVTPNTKLRFELFAQRMGSPVDGVLIVRRENGQELGRNDDQSSTADPAVEVAIPADVDKVQVIVRDLIDGGSDSHAYRLAITDTARAAFSLDVDADRVTIPAGGSALVKVTSRRASYGGPIDLAFDGLPPGVTVSGNQIPGGGDLALVVLSAPGDKLVPSTARLTGSGQQGEAMIRSSALGPDLFRSQDRPWVRHPVAVAAGPTSPLHIVWTPGENDELKAGDKLAAQLQVMRREGATGKVRVRLQTTQPMPRKKVKEGDQEKEVDDIERALRLESELVMDAAANSQDFAASILVPADLGERPWGLVFVAELLSADEKNVVASAVTEARLLGVVKPAEPAADKDSADKDSAGR